MTRYSRYSFDQPRIARYPQRMWRNLLENVHRGKVIPVPDGLEFIVIKKDGSVKGVFIKCLKFVQDADETYVTSADLKIQLMP